MPRSRSRAHTLVPLLLLGACGDDGGGGADARIDAISASCMEATMHSDLTWIQDRIFTPSCADFDSCHMGLAPEAGGLSLERGQSHVQMVGVDSDLFTQFKIVEPNDPMNSYLMIIVGQFEGPLDPDVLTMPYNSPLLCKEKRDAIQRWIEAGAPPES